MWAFDFAYQFSHFSGHIYPVSDGGLVGAFHVFRNRRPSSGTSQLRHDVRDRRSPISLGLSTVCVFRLSIQRLLDLRSFHASGSQCDGQLEKRLISRSFRMPMPAFDSGTNPLLIILTMMFLLLALDQQQRSGQLRVFPNRRCWICSRHADLTAN